MRRAPFWMRLGPWVSEGSNTRLRLRLPSIVFNQALVVFTYPSVDIIILRFAVRTMILIVFSRGIGFIDTNALVVEPPETGIAWDPHVSSALCANWTDVTVKIPKDSLVEDDILRSWWVLHHAWLLALLWSSYASSHAPLKLGLICASSSAASDNIRWCSLNVALSISDPTCFCWSIEFIKQSVLPLFLVRSTSTLIITNWRFYACHAASTKAEWTR